MPSGRTHDSITLWGLPLVVGITFEYTRSSTLTLIATGGYLFSGLMFGPDLDIYSRQYKRWGPLRWIWLPYRRMVRHRSAWSHGPIVGTVVRVGYLLMWLGSFGIVVLLIGTIAAQIFGGAADGRLLLQQWLDACAVTLAQAFKQYAVEGLALGVGLELGALSHTLSDWIGSAYKRWQKRRSRKLPSAAKLPLLADAQTPTHLVPEPSETEVVTHRVPQLSQPLNSSVASRRNPQLPPFV